MSLNKALFRIQGQVSRLPKNSQGHGYKYLDLAGLMEAVIPFSQAEGVLIRQSLGTNDQGWPMITTTLVHVESGEDLSSVACAPPTDMKGRNSNTQEFGATATYLRRYALATALGLVPDDDTDAAIPPATRHMPAKPWSQAEADAVKQEILTMVAFTPAAFASSVAEIEKTLNKFIAERNMKHLNAMLERARDQVSKFAQEAFHDDPQQ